MRCVRVPSLAFLVARFLGQVKSMPRKQFICRRPTETPCGRAATLGILLPVGTLIPPWALPIRRPASTHTGAEKYSALRTLRWSSTSPHDHRLRPTIKLPTVAGLNDVFIRRLLKYNYFWSTSSSGVPVVRASESGIRRGKFLGKIEKPASRSTQLSAKRLFVPIDALAYIIINNINRYQVPVFELVRTGALSKIGYENLKTPKII